MRITNSIIRSGALASVQTNLRRLEEAQTRVTTGLRLRKASDDPGAAGQVMRAGGALRALEQYRRNMDDATARAAAEEGALDSLTRTLERAKELGALAGTDSTSSLDRQAILAEIEELITHVSGLANTKFQDEYLFGGNAPATAPVSRDPATGEPLVAAAVTGGHETEIAAGRMLRTSHNAAEVFGDTGTGAFRALWELREALAADDAAASRAALGTLDSAHTAVQARLADVGARVNQLQVTSANLDAIEANLETFRSNLQEVDLEEAITELVSRQTAYQAAMMATSRVMGLTLADYLR
jgi:flagellar hook-associated protein 3 FlgL